MAKEIYNFTIQRTVEVEGTATKKRKDPKTGKMKEVKVPTIETETVDNKIIIYKPNRRQIEEADMEYTIKMSECIDKKILTRAMLAKKYSDSGGIVTDEDAESLGKSYSKLNELQAAYVKLEAKNKKNSRDKERLEKLALEITDLRKGIVEIESSYSALFAHTADAKAQNQAILWYLVHLTKIQESEDEEPVDLFEGDTFEEKLDSYYEMEDEGDEFYSRISERLPSYISLWYFSQNPQQEDFDRLTEDFNKKDEDRTLVEEFSGDLGEEPTDEVIAEQEALEEATEE